jgi:cytochrome c553
MQWLWISKLLMKRILLPALVPFSVFSAPSGVEYFEKEIRPVLVSECVDCHGAQKQKGGLRLDYRDGWKKGGDSGAAIVPGEPAKSLLLSSIRHDDPEMKMPQKRPKLSDASIAAFEKWIADGAEDPRIEPPKENAGLPWEAVIAERAKWWSLQPIKRSTPPVVADGAWPASDIDRFLLAKMEASGLKPAQNSEPAMLYRRLSFLLVGLPPAIDEVAIFSREYMSDPKGAIARAVDRFLESPSFGEHWARHWLDLVRYAESHGSEGDPEIPESWRYRDYIIRAMNADVPWDALIREHIAGDLVPVPRWNIRDKWNESAIGVAHLRLVEHGFQPIDTRDEQVKTVDSQIDVITKAFQATTVSCARCHDHKFDAVSQRDYTAMAGIFESSRPAMLTVDSLEQLDVKKLSDIKSALRAALAVEWKAEAGRIQSLLESASEFVIDRSGPRASAQGAEPRVSRCPETPIAIEEMELRWSAQRRAPHRRMYY